MLMLSSVEGSESLGKKGRQPPKGKENLKSEKSKENPESKEIQ